MLSRMSDEQADLFRLLSARDWYDDEPELNPFTKKLVADKDLTKAIDVIASQLRRWPGQVSTKQLAMFLAKGYAAPDINYIPGGFTAFMFRPKSAAFIRNPEEERNAIRAMFGDNKLDDESVKYFAKQDFFLASNLPELEEQLRTTLDFLTLLTRSNSIATEGYEFGLRFIDMNRQSFLLAIQQRPTFCVEFAYHLDCVFQGFLYRLGSRHGKKNAVSGSRKELEGFQRKSIAGTLIGFEFGSVPNLRRPIAFTEEVGAPGGEKKTVEPAKAATKPKPGTKPEWWTTNPGLESAWALPEGKAYSEVFNIKDPLLKKNLLLWPELKHHSLGRKKPLCVKYQAVGKCAAGCSMAHQAPAHMPPSAKAAAGKRFAEVYASL